MADYVTDISDPKHRTEHDEYIRQMELQKYISEGKQIVASQGEKNLTL